MGLKGCLISFARMIDDTLKGIPNAITYIDNVLIYSPTPQGAMETLGKVLGRLEKHHLKVNLKKSTFLAPQTEYLGHLFTTNSIKPGKDKTQGILQAHPPLPSNISSHSWEW